MPLMQAIDHTCLPLELTMPSSYRRRQMRRIRVAACHEVVEDAPHYRRFGLIDLQMAWTGRTSRNASVAIGNHAVDDLTSPSTEEPSAPVAFGDLGAFVFSDHALHLNEQSGFSIVVKRRSIQVVNLDSVPGQLVGDQDLVSIAASQPVG